jgi:hypothetical protein
MLAKRPGEVKQMRDGTKFSSAQVFEMKLNLAVPADRHGLL